MFLSTLAAPLVVNVLKEHIRDSIRNPEMESITMKTIRSLAFVALAALALTTTAHAQFTYTFFPDNTTINSDVTTDLAIIGYAGGSYNDDFTRNFTGPSSPTVQVVDGANITSEVDVFNSSIVNVTGGDIAGFIPYDNSVVNFLGGTTQFALNIDNAVFNVMSGYVSDLEGQGKAIHVSGGQMDLLVANVNTDFAGNNLGSCIVDVTGGSIGEVQSFNLGVFNLRGGTIAGDILAAFGGTVNVYGTNLTATLLDANHPVGGSTYSQYALSGVLTDGTVLNNSNLLVRNDSPGDGSLGQSSFHLFAVNAPEPGTLGFLLCGGIGGSVLLRRRGASRPFRS